MGKKTNFTEEEIKLMKEMDAISAQAEANPEIRKTCLPDSLWYELQRDVNEHKEEKKAKEQEQRNQELIKLGLVYEHRRKYRKYYVLAATLILALSLGITSFGGAEKIFNIISGYANGREQTNVNSNESIKEIEKISEESVYEEIERELGFYPVKPGYLPKEIEFVEATIYDELMGINLYYGKEDVAKIIYMIRPNFREGAWGKDVEDELIDEYEVVLPRTIIYVKQYLIEDGTYRWFVLYEYKGVTYSLSILDVAEKEVKKIVDNLYFAK